MTKIGHIDDIAIDAAKSYQTSSGSELFIVNKNNQLFAYQNQCPHLGIELNWEPDQFLDHDNVLIQCATHGALFVIESGECVAGPCLGIVLK